MTGKCPQCPHYGYLTRDHIVPRKFFNIVSEYGLVQRSDMNHPGNIQWLCADCNCRKGWKIPKESIWALELKNELYRMADAGLIYINSKHRHKLGEMFIYR